MSTRNATRLRFTKVFVEVIFVYIRERLKRHNIHLRHCGAWSAFARPCTVVQRALLFHGTRKCCIELRKAWELQAFLSRLNPTHLITLYVSTMRCYTFIHVTLAYCSTIVVCLGLLQEVPRSHSDTSHSVGLLWTSEWSVRRRNLYLKTHHTTQHSQDTDSHALGDIQTRNPSKQAVVNPRRRPRGTGICLFM